MYIYIYTHTVYIYTHIYIYIYIYTNLSYFKNENKYKEPSPGLWAGPKAVLFDLLDRTARAHRRLTGVMSCHMSYVMSYVICHMSCINYVSDVMIHVSYVIPCRRITSRDIIMWSCRINLSRLRASVYCYYYYYY